MGKLNQKKAPQEPELFKIEKSVAPPTYGRNPELEAKIKTLLGSMKVREHFTFPKASRYHINKVLKAEFPEYRTVIKPTDDTKEFFTIWRLI